MADYVNGGLFLTFLVFFWRFFAWAYEFWHLSDKEKKIAESEVISWKGEIDERRKKIKKRRYGNIIFIGHLFERDLLIEKVIHDYCIKALLRAPTDENVESLFHLLVIIGKKIEDKCSAALKRNAAKTSLSGKNIVQSYFDRIRQLMERKTNGLSNRARFRLQDLLDLRESGWKKRSTMLGENGPFKIGDIHKKAAEEEQTEHISVGQSDGTISHLMGFLSYPMR